MAIKFKRETKIIFIILALIILGAVVFISINYKKLKQPNPVSPNPNLAAQAQVKSANVPFEPRGK
jgi:nitric oxide reductase large subunit